MCALQLSVPDQKSVFKPRILVLGVGGAGGNAVNNMIQADLQGVEFAVTNTDAQALEMSLSDRRVRLGTMATQGLGAGANPMVGRAAAEESLQDVLDEIGEVNMVFITAGMGGGTGTGAAPLIAKALKERGVLTVGVATKPFGFEGVVRMRQAEEGIDLFASAVDTLIVIPNENLFRVANERTSYADALKMADEVLYDGVRAISDLIVRPGNINLDFADVRALMTVMGKSMMGTGEADGENRAVEAAELAISNPLLDDINLSSAKGVLLNISGGPDLTMYEVDEAAKRITREVMHDSNIITGTSIDPNLEGTLRVSVVATGIDEEALAKTGVTSGAFARPEPKAASPAPIKPMAPKPLTTPSLIKSTTTPVNTQTSFSVTGAGGVVHTIQGTPGTMEFARSVANPPKRTSSSTSSETATPEGTIAAAAAVQKPRNPIAPLPESLLTPPARNEMIDMRELTPSQTAATASSQREEPAPQAIPGYREAQSSPAAIEARENKLLRAQHEVAQRPASAFDAPQHQPQYQPQLADPAPVIPAPAPQSYEQPAPMPRREPEPRTLFEPLVEPKGPASFDTSYDHHDLFDDTEGHQRPNGPLGRLLDLARGGFSHRPSADDVHEAEQRQSMHESGFDRLGSTPPSAEQQSRRDGSSAASRGLNTGAQRPALTSISTTPMDGPEMDLDESEMNIPAFLRRQMN